MGHTAFRLCTLAALALVSACVAGAPMAIPADQVLAPPGPPARDAHALGGELHVAGGDQLRGHLSGE